MNHETILLITQTYPYDPPGEAFLGAELEQLVRFFGTIYVMPLSRRTGQVRPLPEGAELVDDAIELIASAKHSPWLLLKSAWLTVPMLVRELWRLRSTCLHQSAFGITLAKMVLMMGTAAQAVAKFAQVHHPSLLYAYWLSAQAGSAVLAQRLLSDPLPIVSRAHGHDVYAERHEPPVCPYQPELLARVSQAYVVSKHGRDYLRDKHPDQAHKIESAHLGVAPGKRAAPSDDGVFRIITCSSIIDLKRLDLLAQALRHTEAKIHWTHLGSGPGQAALQQACAELDSANPMVEVDLRGHMPNAEILAFYENNPVDLFVNVSTTEGVPVSIMEALSRGIPVLATNVGGTSELLEERPAAGWLIGPEQTPPSLAEHLQAAMRHLGDPEQRDAAREAAWEAWRRGFSAEDNFGTFAESLRMCISGRQTDPGKVHDGRA